MCLITVQVNSVFINRIGLWCTWMQHHKVTKCFCFVLSFFPKLNFSQIRTWKYRSADSLCGPKLCKYILYTFIGVNPGIDAGASSLAHYTDSIVRCSRSARLMTLRCKHHWRVSRVRESIKLGIWRATLYSPNQPALANPATHVHAEMARKSQVPSAYYGKLLLIAYLMYCTSSLCGVSFYPHGQLVKLIFNGRCAALHGN